MVWEPRLPKTSPSYCLPRPRGSSRPVVATTSRGATRGGKAACSNLVPSQGTPSQATSRLVVMTTGRGKARGVALAWWEMLQFEGATIPNFTGTTTSRGALDDRGSFRGLTLALEGMERMGGTLPEGPRAPPRAMVPPTTYFVTTREHPLVVTGVFDLEEVLYKPLAFFIAYIIE
uniref:Uncharacterized protein n=1 Tax=Solanum tuberosum TaxID=4113 RepID=M1DZS7_SOLTU